MLYLIKVRRGALIWLRPTKATGPPSPEPFVPHGGSLEAIAPQP